ncbi:MAG: MoaD/ThiS family protein [Candidatus Entotheonellia bacterium]
MIKTLNLPGDIPKIVLINGRQTEEDIALHDGDTVSIFPPLAGGR